MEVKHPLETGMECSVKFMKTLLTLSLRTSPSPPQEQVLLPSPYPGSTLVFLFSTFSQDLLPLHLLPSWILLLQMYDFALPEWCLIILNSIRCTSTPCWCLLWPPSASTCWPGSPPTSGRSPVTLLMSGPTASQSWVHSGSPLELSWGKGQI